MVWLSAAAFKRNSAMCVMTAGGGGPDQLREAVGFGVGSNWDDSLDAELNFLSALSRESTRNEYSLKIRLACGAMPRRLALCLSRAPSIVTGGARATLASRLTREARRLDAAIATHAVQYSARDLLPQRRLLEPVAHRHARGRPRRRRAQGKALGDRSGASAAAI